MSRVLFIDTELRNEKLGIMYLSAALKNSGHETMLCWYEKENVSEVIESFSPDFLAFSVTTGGHRKMIGIAGQLKSRYKLKTIFGGPHATFFPESIPEPIGDHIVIGQGERAVVDIVEGRTRERIICRDLLDLNSIPFPDRSLFYRFEMFRGNPMKNIITARDCPYSCSYCYNHTWKRMFGRQEHFMQRRDVDNVIAEAKELKQNHLLKKILFIDDNFIVNTKWVGEFCEKYPREVGLPFLCSFRVNLLTEDTLRKLKEAGLFMVNFALESADPYVQKHVLNRGRITNDHVIQAITLFRKYEIKSRMQNMIGLPLKNSFEDAVNTLKFNMTHRVEDSWVSIFQPYPGTEMANYTLENGFIKGDLEENIANSFFDGSHLDIDGKEKIQRLQKWWYFVIKYNFSEELVEALLGIDLNERVAESLQQLRFQFSRRDLYGLEENEGSVLEHDWEMIRSRLGDHANFPVYEKLIWKHKLCIGLSEILIDLRVPEEIAGRLSEN